MPATASSPPVVLLDDTAADDERLDRLGALPGYDDDDDSDDALGARVDGRRANSSTLHNCLGETVTRQFESYVSSTRMCFVLMRQPTPPFLSKPVALTLPVHRAGRYLLFMILGVNSAIC